LVLGLDGTNSPGLGEIIVQGHEVELAMTAWLAPRVGAHVSMKPPKRLSSILMVRVRVLDDHLAHVARATVGKPACIHQLELLGGEVDVLDDLLPYHGGKRLVAHMEETAVEDGVGGRSLGCMR
jgi:hypothetical protein